MKFSMPTVVLSLAVYVLLCNNHSVIASDISLVEFQGLLYSEVNSEIGHQSSFGDNQENSKTLVGRFLRDTDVTHQANEMWGNIVQHGWDLTESMSTNSNKLYSTSSSPPTTTTRNLKESAQTPESIASKYFPFLVCSQSMTQQSAYNRLKPMLNRTDALFQDAIVVRNDPMKTCYHVSMRYEDAKLISDAMTKEQLDNNEEHYRLTLAPMTDLMKIQIDTMSMIYEDSWVVPKVSSSDDWERTIRVGLSVGHRMNLSKDEVELIAKDIMSDIQDVAKLNKGRASSRTPRRHLQNKTDKNHAPDKVLSISDVFSLTAAEESNSNQDNNGRRLRKNSSATASTKNRWRRALKEGLEEEHMCQVMFERLSVNAHYDNQGFDIVLNPPRQKGSNANGNDNDGIEKKTHPCEHNHSCTASNRHCVASLIMALSTHPLVLSIDVEGPIMANDFESQWITQTKKKGNRPLRDIGINGKDQIISVIDSGLDINHKYFGPTSGKVFDQWDYTQRKVVRYDHSIGDKMEPKGGHGTKVAGAALGRARHNEDDVANGIAEEAKLHVLDIQQGNGGYKMPSAFTLFESMHDTPQGGKPARIANGSWGTRYRAYPYSCKFFDEALHGKFEGDLYVSSAGNEGLNVATMTSRDRTIGNPASCKNTLAVGANQSHGVRIATGANGLDYIAAFSSRGPTFDGRMKPDVLAPGASVLTAYAHEDGRTIQAYGTSYAGPSVAGNAALIRQYFEEGKFPCSWANCRMDPSGSLVKAVLMNSANPVKQVQVSKPWLAKEKLEEVTEYDYNQGFGLIQLDKTLPIPGHNKINAVVRNNKEINDGQFHDIFIRANPGKCINKSYNRDFSATLAWYDPAGTVSCAKCLMNDLDIVVQKVNARGKVIAESEIFPNGASRKDFDNNVERIRFQMIGRQRYRIRIKADNLVSAKTKYSMIATGCFKIIGNPAAEATDIVKNSI